MAPLTDGDNFSFASGSGSEFETCRSIRFIYPRYEAPGNVLLALPCTDRSAEGLGIYHDTALVACQIIADNAFETSRLALDAEGKQPVTVPLNDVLTHDEYYFVVDGYTNEQNPYPIAPSFQDWRFPHGRVPKSWTDPPLDDEESDPMCRVTLYTSPSALGNARVIPAHHQH